MYFYLPISIGNVVYFSYTGIISILGYFMLNETLSKYDIIGLISGFVGIIMLFLSSENNGMLEY